MSCVGGIFKARVQMTVPPEVTDRDHRRGQAGDSANAERPTWAEPISDQTDDRRADGGTSQGYGEEDGHNTPAHDGIG